MQSLCSERGGGVKAEESSGSAALAYVSDFSINEKVTGIGPFDSDNEPGNDTGPDNDIIRSFDTLNYTLKYTTALKTNEIPDTPKLMVSFTLPCKSDTAAFDVSSMQWLEDYTVTDNADGSQTLTGAYTLTDDSGKSTVPGTGTLSVSISVKGAPNGMELKPSFSAWIDGAADAEKKTCNDMVTVSAAPKYNVQIRHNYWTNILGYFDTESGDMAEEANDNTKYGRIQGLGITVQLYNDSVSKGLKGIELPQGDISFDLDFDIVSNTDKNKSLVKDGNFYTYLWDYDENNGTGNLNTKHKGHLGRSMMFNNDWHTDHASIVAPSGGSYVKRAQVYSGGNWSLTQRSDSSYTVTVKDYAFSPDCYFPTNDVDDSFASTKYTANIGCFSVGYVQVIMGIPENVDITTNAYMKAEVSNLKAKSITGQTGKDVHSSDDSVGGNLTLYPKGGITKAIEFPDSLGRTPYTYTLHGDASAMAGSELDIISYIQVYGDIVLRSTDTLLKWDSDCFEPRVPEKIADGTNGGTLKYGNVKVLYAAKPDKTKWSSHDEMISAKQEDLIYFSSYAEMKEKGYTCIGVLLERRGCLQKAGRIVSYFYIKVRDDTPVNETYAVVSDVRAWTSNQTYTMENKTPSDEKTDEGYYMDYPVPNYKVYTKSYVKTEYDENGNIVPGTHAGGKINGNTLLVLGYTAKITKKILSQDISGKTKTNFNMDKGERTVKFGLSPSIEANAKTSKKTALTITDTLPKGLTYKSGTAQYNGKIIEPTITENADGSSVLIWTLEDVDTVTQTLPQITYECTIGHQGYADDVTNNQSLSSTAVIQGEYTAAVSEHRGNTSTVSFTVTKLASLSILESGDKPYIEAGDDFSFSDRITNSGNTDDMIRMYNVLPYSGDSRNTSFNGKYKTKSLTIDLSSAESTYNELKTNGAILLYTSDTGIRSLSKSKVEAYSDWKTVSGTFDDSAKTVTFAVPEDLAAFAMDVSVKANESLAAKIRLKSSEEQKNGDVFVNDFWIREDGGSTDITSNRVSVQILGRFKVKKIWNDTDNKYDSRPNTITVNILQNGVIYKTMEMNKSDTEISVNNLPMYDEEGNRYTYTVEEADCPDWYTNKVTGDSDSGFTIENTYESSGSWTPHVTKKMSYGTLKDKQFEFDLYDASGNLIDTAYNGKDGNVTFSSIALSQSDIGKTLHYTIREKNAGAKYMVYDTKTMYVTAAVSDDGKGHITADVKYDGADEGVFTNKQTFPALGNTGGKGALTTFAVCFVVLAELLKIKRRKDE